jgi:NAD(P)-dependent dehydrogenase (short-subunit alcohol dehydrogenase family)
MSKRANIPKPNGRRDESLVWARRAVTTLDLSGKNVAVVGGTDGLGRALSRLMAARGAHVTIVGRTFRDEGTARIEFVKADLSRMSESRRIGRTLVAERLDVVVLTTGIAAPPHRQVTAEGIELDLAVSYLSRFTAVREFAPRLGRALPADAAPPRVFVMGGPGSGAAGNPDDLNAERAYKSIPAHMNTIAGNEALVLDATQRYPHARFYGLNPGLIKSNIRANLLGPGSIKHRLVEALIGLVTISPEEYAAYTVPLLFAPELTTHGGALFNQKGEAIFPSEALTPERVGAFQAASEALLSRAIAGAPAGA